MVKIVRSCFGTKRGQAAVVRVQGFDETNKESEV